MVETHPSFRLLLITEEGVSQWICVNTPLVSSVVVIYRHGLLRSGDHTHLSLVIYLSINASHIKTDETKKTTDETKKTDEQ